MSGSSYPESPQHPAATSLRQLVLPLPAALELALRHQRVPHRPRKLARRRDRHDPRSMAAQRARADPRIEVELRQLEPLLERLVRPCSARPARGAATKGRQRAVSAEVCSGSDINSFLLPKVECQKRSKLPLYLESHHNTPSFQFGYLTPFKAASISRVM